MENEEEKNSQISIHNNIDKITDHGNEKPVVSPEISSQDKSKNKYDSELEALITNDEMPPEIRRGIQSFLAMQVGGSRHNSLFDKFTEAHIDKYLDYIQRDDDNEFYIRKTNRWFYLLYSVIALGVFIAGVVYLLPNDKDLLIQLIVIIVTLAGGIGAGYGISKR